MKSTRLMAAFVGAIVAATTACGHDAVDQAANSADAHTAPSIDLAKATYEGIYEEPVQLTGGRFEGEPFQPGAASRPVLVLLPELSAHGDLDGDGRDEGVAILVENSGGSGSFIYLAVVGSTESGDRSLATRLLGDRATITTIAIRERTITVGVIAPPAAGPMSGAGEETTRRFRLESGALVESAIEIAPSAEP